jgi:hypothetical protein
VEPFSTVGFYFLPLWMAKLDTSMEANTTTTTQVCTWPIIKV